MSESRRPITDEERPLLQALGFRLRELRVAMPATQRQVAAAAVMSADHLSMLELGKRRTRRSTLERLVAVLVPASSRVEVLDELLALGGAAVAPEADDAFRERVARRRERRARRDRPKVVAELEGLVRLLKRQRSDAPEERAAQLDEMVAGIEEQLTQLRGRSPEPEDEPEQARHPLPARAAYDAFLRSVLAGRRSARLSMGQAQTLMRLRADMEAEAERLEKEGFSEPGGER